MKRNICWSLIAFIIPLFTSAQQNSNDSTQVLGEVIIKAFEQNKQLKQVATAINYIGPQQLERFSNTNILPALNSTPGVRMEERSPGSYRMNIRGSIVRSPFGVRNVKVYWNGIPFTDPGGNTYLNQLSFYNFNSIEIIKGPAGSLYGAGTGGVILIKSHQDEWNNGFELNALFGSFGLNNENVKFQFGKTSFRNAFNYSHQNSNGYRNHSGMRRDIGTWQSKIKISNNDELDVNILYGNLYYQTPGGLTRTEYNNNPKASRPAAGMFPSAETAKAAIYQKTFLAGLNNKLRITERLENVFILYGAVSNIKNPTFRNYEKRKEPHFGGRTFFTFKPKIKNDVLQFVGGTEMQFGNFEIQTYTNVNGETGNLQTNDKIQNRIILFFLQSDIRIPKDWNFTFGISNNLSSIEITRQNVSPPLMQKRTYKTELSPRFAVSKKIFPNSWWYASISKGFSPPTVAEILPSTGMISTSLNAEHGINYETGVKNSWFQNRLYAELNVFYYRLKDAIVLRRDSSNADYFINAGSTKQKGLEAQASYLFFENQNSLISKGKIWFAYTMNDFIYDDFKQNTNDFSGKKIPSVSPNTIAAGIDMNSKKGFYTNINYFFSDKIHLNDANTESASSYSLFGIRMGWKKSVSQKHILEVWAGSDNVFNKKYSLGNDINAAGGRYFNAAAGRNYFLGISFGKK